MPAHVSVATQIPVNQYISLKALALKYFINLSLISPMRFGASTHHHQGLRISCCEKKKHVVVYRCTLF